MRWTEWGGLKIHFWHKTTSTCWWIRFLRIEERERSKVTSGFLAWVTRQVMAFNKGRWWNQAGHPPGEVDARPNMASQKFSIRGIYKSSSDINLISFSLQIVDCFSYAPRIWIMPLIMSMNFHQSLIAHWSVSTVLTIFQELPNLTFYIWQDSYSVCLFVFNFLFFSKLLLLANIYVS